MKPTRIGWPVSLADISIGSPYSVAYKALDRQSVSSCAVAPLRKPPPGSTPLAKFRANGRSPAAPRAREATSVVSFATVTTVTSCPLSRDRLSVPGKGASGAMETFADSAALISARQSTGCGGENVAVDLRATKPDRKCLHVFDSDRNKIPSNGKPGQLCEL